MKLSKFIQVYAEASIYILSYGYVYACLQLYKMFLKKD